MAPRRHGSERTGCLILGSLPSLDPRQVGCRKGEPVGIDRDTVIASARAEGRVWHEWGGSGPVLHFAHANGFPSGTYRKFLRALTARHRVVSTEARPLWPGAEPVDLRDWSLLVADLRAELGRRGLRGIVGVGHSLGGAVTLLAAAADPGLFSVVVAVDPVILTGLDARVWGLVKAMGLRNRNPLARGARHRRRSWPDRQAVRAAYASKRVFATWDPEVLNDYVAAGTVELEEGGVGLRYPREWEARIFAAAPHDLWPQLRRVSVPTLFVQGALSNTFVDAARTRVEREVDGARTVVVADSSHFLPMERPIEVARIANAFLEQVGP
jgi:pimeloyl-ACP methyl ester carboxylesterase